MTSIAKTIEAIESLRDDDDSIAISRATGRTPDGIVIDYEELLVNFEPSDLKALAANYKRLLEAARVTVSFELMSLGTTPQALVSAIEEAEK